MATTNTPNPTAVEIWTVIKKEITGIQLLWETVNGLYFQPQGTEWRTLEADVPLLFHLTQTALMESLLMRVSRMLDPAATGKLKNLSLKQLVAADANIDADEKAIRAIWDSSGLAGIRNKYLSHNDLERSLTEKHTLMTEEHALMTKGHALNIPLSFENINALKALAEGLRELRRNVTQKLSQCAYVDQLLDAQSLRDIEVLGKSLLGGRLFFELLPDQPVLQQAFSSAEARQ